MSWDTDQRYAHFDIDGVKFALTFQDDDDYKACAVVLWWDGVQWAAWGAPLADPPNGGWLAIKIDDAKIMAHGSLRDFIVWCCGEALVRATEKARIPLPDPNDRIARLKYNLLMSVDWNGTGFDVKPAPLP